MAATFNTPNGRVEAVPTGRGRWQARTKPGGSLLGEIELDADRGGCYLATPIGEPFHVCTSLRGAAEFLGGK